MGNLYVSLTGTGTGTGSGSWFTLILVYAVIIGAFYFFAIRPQKKKQKAQDAMVAAIEVGDSILTTSGFYGVIIDISEDVIIVEFRSEERRVGKEC